MNTFNIYEEARDYSVSNPLETVEYKTYHDNGQLREHSFYVCGKEHGESKLYHDNGQLRRNCFCVADVTHGEYKSYLSDGDLMFHCFFVNGKTYNLDHLRDGSYKSLCIKHTLFNGNVFDEDI